MSVAFQTPLPTTRSHRQFILYSTHVHHLRPPLFPLPLSPTPPLHLRLLSQTKPYPTLHFPLKAAFQSHSLTPNQSPSDLNLDAFLSLAEFLCLAPSLLLSIASAVNYTFFSSRFQVSVMNKVFVWQVVLLVGAVVFSALIRTRQWKRICVDSAKSGGGSSFNLVHRIDKLEDDLRSSATVIRVLSRQVEKLGIRFRVTRKTLKDPISETAALAQKNSEATRVLAIQEDILEKELGEIQKVLLAMQEQQQKQLELILAMGKAGKLKDIMRASVAEKVKKEVPKSVVENDATKQTEIQTQTESTIHQGNDRS